MALYRCSSGSGGSGKKIKYGTTTADGQGQMFSITTGLTSIDKFFFHSHDKGAQTYQMQAGMYYTKDDPNYHLTSMGYGSYRHVARDSFQSTPATYSFEIKEISGGTVTCFLPNNDARAHQDIQWLAVGD